ncbi:MAG: MBL fold metallo-hydrolase [Candidatus Hydrogenedentes bacterium]|nr:MBL fold metallo-hydrolase [Candidatus Hydrogenedentota bacterium]
MVKHWDVVTIGNVSRNRYWGESEERAVRPVICTCTAIFGDDFVLVVDPSLEDRDRMAFELDRRTGLKLDDVGLVFLTHAHGDHWVGLPHFGPAEWLAAPSVAQGINGTGKLAKQVEPVEGRIRDSIDVVHTPGHTLDHHSLRFDCDGYSIVVAGDAVMNRDFWRERRGFFNSVDKELAGKTIERLWAFADIVVPGHDNYFLAQRRELGEQR